LAEAVERALAASGHTGPPSRSAVS
jgi:hypothetical protein